MARLPSDGGDAVRERVGGHWSWRGAGAVVDVFAARAVGALCLGVPRDDLRGGGAAIAVDPPHVAARAGPRVVAVCWASAGGVEAALGRAERNAAGLGSLFLGGSGAAEARRKPHAGAEGGLSACGWRRPLHLWQTRSRPLPLMILYKYETELMMSASG